MEGAGGEETPTIIPEQAYIGGSGSQEMEYGARSLPPAGLCQGLVPPREALAGGARDTESGYLSTFYFSPHLRRERVIHFLWRGDVV